MSLAASIGPRPLSIAEGYLPRIPIPIKMSRRDIQAVNWNLHVMHWVSSEYVRDKSQRIEVFSMGSPGGEASRSVTRQLMREK